MDKGQQSNRLTIKHPWGSEYIISGLLLILGGGTLAIIVAIAVDWRGSNYADILGILSCIFMGLATALVGLYLLSLRSRSYIFDRSKGELAILRWTLTGRKKEILELAKIKAVEFVDNGVIYTQDANIPGGFNVRLVVASVDKHGNPKDKNVAISGSGNWKKQKAVAEKVASFLGMYVDEVMR